MIEGWISDFFETEEFRGLPGPAKEYASEILPVFLTSTDVEEADCRAGLLERVAGLALPASVRSSAPDLCAAFLETLEAQGRVAGGRSLGRFVRALRTAYDEKTADTVKTIRNPGAKVGRNEPCPCGSGRKFKSCCLKRS